MNIKREILAGIVRVLAENTNLIRKPSDFEERLNTMFGGESYDRRIAADLETELDKVTDAAKRFNTNRKFKKITQHI